MFKARCKCKTETCSTINCLNQRICQEVQAASSSRTSFCTGRSTTDGLFRRLPSFPRFLSPKRIFTLLTNPSLSTTVSITSAKRHSFLGRSSTFSKTISPACMFLLGVSQHCLVAMLDTYSLRQRPQNCSAKYWTWRHLLRAYMSSLTNLPGGGRAWVVFKVSR